MEIERYKKAVLFQGLLFLEIFEASAS